MGDIVNPHTIPLFISVPFFNPKELQTSPYMIISFPNNSWRWNEFHPPPNSLFHIELP